MVENKIPAQQDVPALVALLSEQIQDVKTSIDDLKTGLNDGLKHLEIRLDDHAMRLTSLERAEIRREEAERVRGQMFASFEQANDNLVASRHVQFSRWQVWLGLAGLLLACATFVAAEIHSAWG